MIGSYIILLLISILSYGINSQKPTISLNDLLDQTFMNESMVVTNAPVITTSSVTISETSTHSVSEKPQPTDEIEPYEPVYTPCEGTNLCVPFYQCKSNGSFNFDGENIIDIRFDDKRPCASYLETCCKTDVTSIDQTIRNPKPIEDIKNACGVRNINGLVFKVTGNKENEAEYAEFPWMVGILQKQKTDTEILQIYQCGGSLIHPQAVLTGAHCVYKYEVEDLIVRAGEWDTQTQDEIYREEDRQVIEMVLHEKFSKSGLYNDIAILIISEPFILQKHINTICLPPPNINFDNSKCVATGWGKDQFGLKGKYQVIMKKIDLPVVPNDVCQMRLSEGRLGKFFKLHESFICAGGEKGKDTCKGDGGGPLSCPIPGQEGRYYQAGIVAWGIGCDGEFPGAYASTAYLRDWIDNIMTSRNFDSVHYTAL